MPLRQPRMIVSCEGADASGKTHFALSAPRPMVYLDFDHGLEGVEGDEPEELREFDLSAVEWMDPEKAKRHVREEIGRFVAAYRKAFADKMRSVVVDTFTAAWKGQRVARGDDRYIEYEAEFLALIQLAYKSPHTNLILLHHVAPDWKQSSDGKRYKALTFSRDGMDGIQNTVQLALRHRHIPPVGKLAGRFEADVLKCRDNVGYLGQTIPVPRDDAFANVCGTVCPEVDWTK